MNELLSDNQTTIYLAKNSTFPSRTKDISLYYQFVKSLLKDRVLTLMKIRGSKNSIDMLAKVVITKKFNKLFECIIFINH